MGIKLRKSSECFKWLNSLKVHGIYEFYYKDLPKNLKGNKILLYKALMYEMLESVETCGKGTTKWRLNLDEISRINKGEDKK